MQEVPLLLYTLLGSLVKSNTLYILWAKKVTFKFKIEHNKNTSVQYI